MDEQQPWLGDKELNPNRVTSLFLFKDHINVNEQFPKPFDLHPWQKYSFYLWSSIKSHPKFLDMSFML